MIAVEESLRQTASLVDVRLPELVDSLCDPGTLRDAMRYSLLSMTVLVLAGAILAALAARSFKADLARANA